VSLYAPEKLIAQARKLAADYRRAMGRPLPGVGNEIAEHDAIRLLNLVPRGAGEEGGFQALDPARADKRIQIKSRTIFDESKSGHRIGQLNLDREWDSVVLVIMDPDYEPFEIYEVERKDIEAYTGKSSQGRAKRGAMSVARFKIIGRLVWARDGGADPGLWDNQAR
jgi:hypothetical protein